MDYSRVTSEILNNPRFVGAVSSIEWLTNLVDRGFTMVITAVAFLIILVAMLKNVLAGAYCAFPKFWDEVHKAHTENEQKAWVDRFRDTFNSSASSYSLSHAILSILPNIKHYTDFEKDTQDAKGYFIKAIPQMMACIIIGAFIYNGYYRDVAVKVVDFGSTMISRTLLEVNPVAVFDRLTGSVGRPTFATDDSKNFKDQLINKLAVDTYSAVIGEYHDINRSEAKRALAAYLENKMTGLIDGPVTKADSALLDGVSYKYFVQAAITNGEVDTRGMENGKQSEDKLTWQFILQFPVSELGLDSSVNIDLPMYVRVRLNFQKQAARGDKNIIKDLKMTLGTGDSEGATTAPYDKNLYFVSTKEYKATKGDSTLTVKIALNPTKNQYEITTTVTGGDKKDTYTLDSPILLQDKANNVTHTITTIDFGTNTTAVATLSSATYTKPIGWDNTEMGKKDNTQSSTPTASAAASPAASPAG